MKNIKKRFASVAFTAVAVCALAGNISAVQYGDNVVTDAGKYTSSVTNDFNNDSNFDICDLVKVKKATLGLDTVSNNLGLELDKNNKITESNVNTLRKALLEK